MLIRHAPKTLVLLGSGIRPDGKLTPASERRAQTTFAYAERYEIGRIICTGAFGRFMNSRPPEGVTEASALKDFLIKLGIAASLVDTEEESKRTFETFEQLAERNYFEKGEFSITHPVGVVTGWEHGLRVRPIASQALGISRLAIHMIYSPDQLSRKQTALELGGAMLTEMALLGARPGNIGDTRLAADRYDRLMNAAHDLPALSGIL